MKQRLHPLLLVLVLFPVFGGCVGQAVRLANAGYDTAQFEPLGNARGTATGMQILGAIPMNLNDKIERAKKQAIASVAGGEELANVKITESGQYFFFVNILKVEVEGLVLKRK